MRCYYFPPPGASSNTGQIIHMAQKLNCYVICATEKYEIKSEANNLYVACKNFPSVSKQDRLLQVNLY